MGYYGNKKRKKHEMTVVPGPVHRGSPWSREEEKKVVVALQKGYSLGFIAEQHQRSPRAISFRIGKLVQELLDSHKCKDLASVASHFYLPLESTQAYHQQYLDSLRLRQHASSLSSSSSSSRAVGSTTGGCSSCQQVLPGLQKQLFQLQERMDSLERCLPKK